MDDDNNGENEKRKVVKISDILGKRKREEEAMKD